MDPITFADPGVLHDERVARFPVHTAPVVDVVAFALHHEKDGGIHVAVRLTVSMRGEGIHMGLD